MHFKAEMFDIGIYYESNGHGTVLTKIQKIEQYLAEHSSSEEASIKLLDFLKLTNEAVGDALTNFLMVETVLRSMGWSILDVDNLYHDYPNVMI